MTRFQAGGKERAERKRKIYCVQLFNLFLRDKTPPPPPPQSSDHQRNEKFNLHPETIESSRLPSTAEVARKAIPTTTTTTEIREGGKEGGEGRGGDGLSGHLGRRSCAWGIGPETLLFHSSFHSSGESVEGQPGHEGGGGGLLAGNKQKSGGQAAHYAEEERGNRRPRA